MVMTTTEAKQLLADVRANVARLNACPRHDFQPTGPTRPLMQRYACTACGGQIDSLAFHWYTRGLAHGATR